uniref:Protein phosphatase n=1 Tax=Kwoniella bestiolae CBS 10118 TaxID=1296100 RepID=A0A1B9FYR4_9TREE|nr:hypothetical protein I302_06898 [Kwoniella bestiolae CBS 10118]OCF23912.1 hypothetical protein I302_06898 [Kwoniella bestiolae CBS 10118]
MVLLRSSLPRSLRSTLSSPFHPIQSRFKSTSPTISPLYPTSSSYNYSLGLSYASKYSPPFIPPNQKIPPYGFMSRDKDDGITKWVNEMMDFPAGRGELTSGQDGGWTEEVRKGVRRWGAGEDFFGIQRVGNDLHLSLSDGVGGWTDRVDPSLFSQALCYHYSTIASQFNSSDPVEILDKAYRQLLDDQRVIAGGATLVGVRLGEEGDASFVNLGDSGYAIMRNDQIKYISKPQTHFFNCPLQLSKIPKDMRQAGIIHDQPSMADLQNFELETGDVVILFTDGLSDNLPTTHLPLLSSSLTQLLNSPLNSHLTLSERDAEFARLFSDILVGYGRMAMARTGDEKGWKTPFEIEATREVPQNGWRGGKVDE